MTATSEQPRRGPGRPRDPDVDTRIVQACLRLFARHGLDSWSVDQLASEAGVGKAAIYRRWDTREQVQAAAVTHLGQVSWRKTSQSTVDQIAQLIAGELQGDRGLQLAAVVGALIHRPDLVEAWTTGPRARLRRELVAITAPSPLLSMRIGQVLSDVEDVIAILRHRHLTSSVPATPGAIRAGAIALLQRHTGTRS